MKFLIVALSLMVASPAFAQDAGPTDTVDAVSNVLESSATDTVEQSVAPDVIAADVVEAAPAAPSTTPTEPTVAPPETDEQAIGMVGDLIAAAKGGQWFVFAGFLLMIVIYAIRRFGLLGKLPSSALPWVTLVLGCITFVSMGLASGMTFGGSLLLGFLTSSAAALLWDAVGKHVAEWLSPKKS
jgi:hypothetical protein